MATKAELEAELAALRKQIAETPPPADPEEPDPGEAAPEPEAENPQTDWEAELSDILESLEDFPQKQPLLLALGAFAVGYLIGRSR